MVETMKKGMTAPTVSAPATGVASKKLPKVTSAHLTARDARVTVEEPVAEVELLLALLRHRSKLKPAELYTVPPAEDPDVRRIHACLYMHRHFLHSLKLTFQVRVRRILIAAAVASSLASF